MKRTTMRDYSRGSALERALVIAGTIAICLSTISIVSSVTHIVALIDFSTTTIHTLAAYLAGAAS